MKAPLALLAALCITGCVTACVTAPVEAGNGLANAGIGQTVRADGPIVTPLAVLEDSRCPSDVRCVWAGRLRISARIDLGSGSQTRELTLGKPEPVADGTLELVEALPARTTKTAIRPGDYRFAFRFMGGL